MAKKKIIKASSTEITVIDFGGGYLKKIEGPLDTEDKKLTNKHDNTSVTCIGESLKTFLKTAKGDDGKGKHKVEIEMGGSTTVRAPGGWCSGPCNPSGITCAPGKVPMCVLVAGQWILRCVDSKDGEDEDEDDDECDEK